MLHPPLRDELYLQVLKQLRRNPNDLSERLGYALLKMCLATFPPTEQIENHLEYHLRYGAMKEEEERMGMVRLLHEIVYKGPTDERGTFTTVLAGCCELRVVGSTLVC